VETEIKCKSAQRKYRNDFNICDQSDGIPLNGIHFQWMEDQGRNPPCFLSSLLKNLHV